ncbi:MAG TPA: type II toxin-antitoxin system VapC family toxin [Solirubrobacteraceae bacterium]|nr:type II toxin-antitoxin system VapC family toxin [Solirubrobacteraceae bacterium]
MKGVLDAWVVMAVLRGEPAAERARALMGAGMVMSSINLGEVYYALVRSHGPAVAEDRTAAVRRAIQVETPDWPLVAAAARVKAAGGISYADAFCVASAERHQGPLYTGDPEILALEIPVRRIDLRAP